MPNVIEVSGLAKYYGRAVALRDFNLSAAAGEFIALFGRNGAGKTTFLRILAGLSRPSSGTFRIQPSNGAQLRYVRGAIGYLSHNTVLYADLTALENMRFYARLMDVAADEESLVKRIEEVGLAGREKEPVRNYSRGMQQRLAIARAFMHNPDILLLDEPFTGLDQGGAEFLTGYLLKAQSQGKICIMTIHDTKTGYEMADRLIVIDRGVAAIDVQKASLTLNDFQERYRRIVEERRTAKV
jgi:heme exporter protein A